MVHHRNSLLHYHQGTWALSKAKAPGTLTFTALDVEVAVVLVCDSATAVAAGVEVGVDDRFSVTDADCYKGVPATLNRCASVLKTQALTPLSLV